MEAKELRIGNYVKAFDGVASIGWPEVGKKFQIDLCVFELLSNEDNGYSMQFIEPIPLTEQWLLDFGFEFMSSQQGQTYYHINGWTVLYTYGSWYYSTSKSITIGLKLQFVHQLQNRYFSLVGEELTLKKNMDS